MKDPALHTMSAEMMDIMIRDWLADNPDTAEDLTVDFSSIRFEEEYGYWAATATDKKGIAYTLTSCDGDIIINY